MCLGLLVGTGDNDQSEESSDTLASDWFWRPDSVQNLCATCSSSSSNLQGAETFLSTLRLSLASASQIQAPLECALRQPLAAHQCPRGTTRCGRASAEAGRPPEVHSDRAPRQVIGATAEPGGAIQSKVFV